MTNRHDTTGNGGTDAQHRIPEGVVGLQTENDELLVYDREKPKRWIQSDETRTLTEMR